MKLFIRINRRQNDYRSRAEGIIRKLVENGFEVSLFKVDARAVFSSEEYASFGVEESDYVVSIGGDGTFLKGGLLAATYDKPVFGVNIGRLGYLCRFDEKSLETLTPEVLTGCPIEEKMLLEVSDSELLAINDVVIGKDYFGTSVELQVEAKGHAPYSVRGDGVIISTPLGSTGYNESAGGPLIEGENSIVITPICASNKAKPLIVDKECVIKVRNINPSYGASVYIDGVRIEWNGTVEVRMAERKLKKVV